MNKKVQFSCDVEFVSTFANEDYDRTAQEVAKLTYKDMLELLTMKSQWKRDMERMLAERASVEGEKECMSSDEESVTTGNTTTSSHLYSSSIQEICI